MTPSMITKPSNPDGDSGAKKHQSAAPAWPRQGVRKQFAALRLQAVVLAALNLWVIVFALRVFSGGAGNAQRWAPGFTLAAIAAIVAVAALVFLTMRRPVGSQAGEDPGFDPAEASFEYTAWRSSRCRELLSGALIQFAGLLGLGIGLVYFAMRTLDLLRGQAGQLANRGMMNLMLLTIAAALIVVLWYLQGNLRRMNSLRREMERLESGIDPLIGPR